MLAHMIILYSALVGFFASCLSSIFGGGFGLLSVPAIFWIISHFYADMPQAMQVTIATGSLCSIPLGIIASYKQIVKYKNFDAALYNKSIVFMTMGALIGAFIASIVHSDQIRYTFAIVVLIAAIWLLFFNKEKDTERHVPRSLYRGLSGFVGGISTLTGVSVFTVPFFVLCGIKIKKAIGTSTVIVFTYSSIAGIWLICLGIPTMGISWHNFGYANLVIFASALIPCLIGGLTGAKLVHILPSQFLRKIFILMMFIVAISMLI